jgi:hypothetical protein
MVKYLLNASVTQHKCKLDQDNETYSALTLLIEHNGQSMEIVLQMPENYYQHMLHRMKLDPKELLLIISNQLNDSIFD